MKLSKKTLNVFKYLSTVYPSILVRKGDVLRTRNTSKTALVKAKIDETFPMDFVIYDIANFLKVANLFTEPNIAFVGDTKSGYMELSEGTAKIRYKFASPELHTNIPPDEDFVPKNVKWSMKVKLDQNEITNIINASKAMSLDIISFTNDGIKLSNSHFKDFTNFEISYQNSVEYSDDAPEEFSINFATASFNLVDGDYVMESFCGSQNGAKFYQEDDSMVMWLGCLPSSKV